MTEFDARPVTAALFDPFPTARNDLQVGIHGFGAIGGRLLALIFSHWDGLRVPLRSSG